MVPLYLLFFVAVFAAIKYDFFKLKESRGIFVSFNSFAFVFLVYFITNYYLLSILHILLPPFPAMSFIANFFILLIALIACRKKGIKIYSRGLIYKDILYALFLFFLAFPIANSISYISSEILRHIFHIKEFPPQEIIDYLKNAKKVTIYFATAVFYIVVIVPIIEEIIFRGFLQNHLKTFLSRKNAIIVSSIIFSIFHISLTQKFSNIPIVLSLFSISIFLGFIYEKQKSLLSPIVLHATVNGFSVFSLFLLN